ncbi:MAG TPA: hypothetical protein VN759_13075 [Pseudolysinimonas sp.]|nr:hypothetical protein [Pseudolysinimonas sp.]
MTRRLVLTAVGAATLLASAITVAGLVLVGPALAGSGDGTRSGQSASAAPHAAGTPSPIVPPTPTPTPTVPASAIPTDQPLAERLRPLRPGDQPPTLQQLRDFAAAMQGAPSWADEKAVEVACMASAGYYWDPRTTQRAAMTDPAQSAAPIDAGARLALDGTPSTPYRWQDAGCRGLGIHEKGTGD